MVELDNLHYSYREVDSYNKPFNFIMSPREPGKTSMMWFKKIYQKWKVNKKPWIYLVRQSVEITEALITSIQDTIINKFSDDNVTLAYTKGSFKDGIVDVRIGDEIFFRIISLSIQLRRIKLAVLKNIGGVLMDEYIIDPRTKESYITNEAFKIKEAYSTWRREAEGILKVYFLANPYSLYNPLFMDWGVDVNKLKKGQFYVGNNYVIHWAMLNPLLKEKLLRDNPLYEFDENYKGYALEGGAINDQNIQIDTLPPNFSLKFVFKFNEDYIGVFQSNLVSRDYKYFVKEVDNISAKRTVYCFNFADMVDKCIILSLDDRFKLQRFKDAIRTRAVKFENVNMYYIIQEIYQFI